MNYLASTLAVILLLSAGSANSQTLTTLIQFTGTGGTASGGDPRGSLTLSPDGTTLYGMTGGGGAGGYGNIFSVGTNGAGYQDVLEFTGTRGTASGWSPVGSLLLSGSTLYGMTVEGGASRHGNIFSVGANGTNYRDLVDFTGSGGAASGYDPRGSLLLSGTTLYGMTRYGGVPENPYNGSGNIFSVGVNGSNYQDLYDFTGGNDGKYPFGDLTLSGGTLFGMTSQGGANNDGTVFALAGAVPSPEPGSLALLVAAVVIGFAGLAWRRRVAGTAKPAAFDQQDPAILSFPSHTSPATAARRAA